MDARALVPALVVACSPGSAARQEPAPAADGAVPLALSASIELPGVRGRIDHLAVDLARGRAFVAALGNDSVEVVDLEGARHLRSVGGLGEPQGILYLAGSDRVVVACGEGGACVVLDGTTLERVARIEVGSDPDNLRYDAQGERVVVAFGSGALGVLDARDWKSVGRATLDGHPEGFQLDRDGSRAWVNVPGARQIALVDLRALEVRATWPLEEAGANYPMALVPPGEGAPADDAGLLLVGCRSPAKLVVRSASTGDRVQALDLSGDTDDIFYDARRRRAYAVCGAGTVDVLERDEHGGFHLLARVPTAPGARTGLFVPERDELLVAAPARGGQPARILRFNTATGRGEPPGK